MFRKKMSAQKLDRALTELLAADDLDEALHSSEDALEPLLHAAMRVRRHYGDVPAPPGGLAAGRQRMLAAAARERREMERQSSQRWRVPMLRLPSLQLAPAWRAVTIVLVSVLFFSSLSGGVVLASENSLPGEPLYVVKQVVEDARLGLAPPASRADLALGFANLRLAEMRALQDQGRAVPDATVERFQEQVSLAMALGEAGEDTIGVEDVAVEVERQLAALGALAQGAPPDTAATIEEAREQLARQLQAVTEDEMDAPSEPSGGPGAPEPTPTPTLTEPDTAAPVGVKAEPPTATPQGATPTSTVSEPTVEPTATFTPESSATATSEPTPSATPTDAPATETLPPTFTPMPTWTPQPTETEKRDDDDDKDDPTPEPTAAPPTPAPPTEEPTSEPVPTRTTPTDVNGPTRVDPTLEATAPPEPTPEPTQAPEPTSEPTAVPVTPAPPTPKPTAHPTSTPGDPEPTEVIKETPTGSLENPTKETPQATLDMSAVEAEADAGAEKPEPRATGSAQGKGSGGKGAP